MQKENDSSLFVLLIFKIILSRKSCYNYINKYFLIMNMSKTLKIFVGVVVFLGVLSGAFVLFAKKKPQTTDKVRISQTQNKTTNPVQKAFETPVATTAPNANTNPEAQATQDNIQKRKTLIRSQWTQCKERIFPADTNLFWNVQIIEGIPVGGTYAKGNLDNDSAYPVRVIIKTDSQDIEKIKEKIIVGKTAFLKGTCTDVAPDGAVILQAF